ncbi:MAG TPA: hypothetical protein VNV25_25700 [Gemmatimonadaceae bacterium]|jgi:hypothetical protein|nr:hypothetical protein [Gemmatimonadaceae bacterium]
MDHPFHAEAQKFFPDFDYKRPAGDRNVLCDMRNPGNMVGHQQRAFSCFWALRTCGPTDLGLDLGSPRGLTPYCVHVDIFGDGRVHPFYGGGEYRSDVVWDAADVSKVFPDKTFPFVGSNHSLEHMAAPGDGGIVEVLCGWLRLLRPGGILAMIVPDNAHFDVMASDKDHRHAWSHDDFRPRVLDHVLARGGVDLIEYDTLDNHFSFDVVLRKTS